MSAPSLETLIDLAHRTADFWSAQGYEEYLGSVTIDCGLQPRRFRDVANDWQWDRSLEICPALEQLAGVPGKPPYTGPLNFWWEFSKGHDKTTSTAREMNWLLAYSRRPLVMYACGGDKDQAALIRLAMERELELNPWLKSRVEVTGYHARGLHSGSILEILATDASTAQGKFPDYVVVEEVCAWKHERSREFWEAMVSSTTKKTHCLLKVNTNAGFKGTWQEAVRKEIVKSPIWKCRVQAPRSTLASWMSPAKIAEVRKLLFPAEADRVYGNVWVDPGAVNGYLTLDEAEACVDPSFAELHRTSDPMIRHWLAVDYGGVHDRTALVVGHNPRGTDHAVIDRLDCWQGSHAAPVEIGARPGATRTIEDWILEQCDRFRPIAGVVLDKHEMVDLGRRLERKGLNVIMFEYKGGKNNYRMADLFRQKVRAQTVKWSPHAGFLDGAEDDTFAKEIAGLILKVMEYGYKFDHKSGKFSDRTCAVAMMLLHMLESIAPPHEGPTFIQRSPTNPIHQVNSIGVQSSVPIFGIGASAAGNPFGRR